MDNNPTAELAERKVPAENFMQTLDANVDNEMLSEAEFREMIRNTLPIVVFPRVAAAKPLDQPKSKAELIRDVRRESLDLHRSRYMVVLEGFSLESFSVARLSEMPTSRLQELLDEIRQQR